MSWGRHNHRSINKRSTLFQSKSSLSLFRSSHHRQQSIRHNHLPSISFDSNYYIWIVIHLWLCSHSPRLERGANAQKQHTKNVCVWPQDEVGREEKSTFLIVFFHSSFSFLLVSIFLPSFFFPTFSISSLSCLFSRLLFLSHNFWLASVKVRVSAITSIRK